ncbi:MAG: TetR/AcrR family transcriptional regulator [Bacteroidetes bacterium]|nr:TetR/AcrR family transcriptional regulator [Bacteroidota bacterium]
MPRTKSFNEEDMLDKAKDLFWRKGFNGTPPQDILDETGLSRSSLYDTYGDKYTLFIKTLQRYRDRETSAVIDFIDQAEDIPQAFRQLFQETYRECLSSQGRRGCFMINTVHELVPHDARVETIVQENRQATEDALARAIRRGQQKGQIAKEHQPRSLARFLLNALWGLTTQVKLGIDKKIADDIIKTTLSFL